MCGSCGLLSQLSESRIGGDKLVANRDIVQNVHIKESSLDKLEALNEIIGEMDREERGNGCHTVVFVNRKRDADNQNRPGQRIEKTAPPTRCARV